MEEFGKGHVESSSVSLCAVLGFPTVFNVNCSHGVKVKGRKREKTESLYFINPRLCLAFNDQEERRVLYVGRLRADSTRSELKRRFEVFGEIEECAINLRHNG